ncbi:aspartate/glutamate racemase family protein [[Clostridium] hylemonae]|uniref:aspartate/glutamate racemase family protein n=1 Tax=[Clostridium] hylemonae TaxID=89153 RepID=UPI001FCCB6B8|nr:aspartate/glutamate racemase family protein [[Clostridium] hylemonae]
MMKLKLILPVADTPATRKANEGIPLALRTLDPETEVSVSFLKKGFEALNTITRIGYNSPGIAEAAVTAEKEGADGIFINCFADPAVDMARELVHVPVFGGFRSAMMAALGCGKRFAVMIPGKEDPAGTFLLNKVIENNPEFKDSIVRRDFTDLDVLELHDKEKLLERLAGFAEESACRYDCDCLILGCTAMSYIIDDLRAGLCRRGCRITVLEPLSTGLKMLESFVTLGLNNSTAHLVNNEMDQLIK